MPHNNGFAGKFDKIEDSFRPSGGAFFFGNKGNRKQNGDILYVTSYEQCLCMSFFLFGMNTLYMSDGTKVVKL